MIWNRLKWLALAFSIALIVYTLLVPFAYRIHMYVLGGEASPNELLYIPADLLIGCDVTRDAFLAWCELTGTAKYFECMYTKRHFQEWLQSGVYPLDGSVKKTSSKSIPRTWEELGIKRKPK